MGLWEESGLPGRTGSKAHAARPQGRICEMTQSPDKRLETKAAAFFFSLTVIQGSRLRGSAGTEGKVTEFISWRQLVPTDGQEMPNKAKRRQNPGLAGCGVRLNPGEDPGEEGPGKVTTSLQFRR